MKEEASRYECTQCSSEAVVHVTDVERGEVVESHYCDLHAPDDVQRIAERELRRMHASSTEWRSVIGQLADTPGIERSHAPAMRRSSRTRFRSNES